MLNTQVVLNENKFQAVDSSADAEARPLLIALIPQNAQYPIDLAKHIHDQAMLEKRDVLLLALITDRADDLSAARLLTTLESAIRDNFVQVKTCQILEKAWLVGLTDVYRPGDRVLCAAEQLVHQGRLGNIPLSEAIDQLLGAPVTALEGYYQPAPRALPAWLRSLIFWTICLGSIVAFFGLEGAVDTQVMGFVRPVLLLILLGFEMGLILIFNGILN